MSYYAALITVMELLKDIIHRQHYPGFLLGRQPIMKSLLEKFSLLEESLQDYASKEDEAGDPVEGLIRDAAYKAQDIIESEISKHKSRNVIKKTFHSLKVNLKMDLKKVDQEIDSLLVELAAIKERRRGTENLQPNYDFAGIRASEQLPVGKNIVVGFDNYLITIKDELCGQSSKLQVIPIVGPGGIGKTTLAKYTFDDALITCHFDYRAWVTVSQTYNIKKVLHNLMKSLELKVDGSNEEDELLLKERIYKHLIGRRYLVIIDDIWSTRAWDDIKRVFPDDDNGSRVVLTTRLLDVAQFIATSRFVHQIHFLSMEDSWNLFREKVFGLNSCPQELEEIGRFIVSKCYGLPFAIVLMAGILSNVRLPREWKHISMNMSTILSRTKHLFSVLSLSYNHLPHQLKVCFLYMGSFPEDYEISVKNLILMWVAEGFLKSSDEFLSLEKLGMACVENLVKRNLVLVTKKSANGQVKSCVLHDLLREFCKYKASQEYFFVINTLHLHQGKVVENVRRFNVHGDFFIQPDRFNPNKSARSFLWFAKDELSWSLYEPKWDMYELFRVLGVYNRNTSGIPNAVLRMLHLKYLHLSVIHHDGRIHPSIMGIQNLQTLILRSTFTITLPPQIWKLTQLRHLLFDKVSLPPVPMVGDIPMRKLGYMQTLMGVYDFTFTIEAIEMIPSLRKLKTSFKSCGSDDKWELFCLKNLIHLLQLEELKISFVIFAYPPPRVASIIPSSFGFPVHLRKLSLVYCGLPWNYLTVVGSLPNLQVLRLKDYSFVGEEWEPTEGAFRSLKFLLLERLDLKYWRADNTHFPCLQHLKIRSCKHLEIPLEIGDIPTLKFIDVYESKRAEESVIQIREEQENMGNDMLEIRIGHR